MNYPITREGTFTVELSQTDIEEILEQQDIVSAIRSIRSLLHTMRTEIPRIYEIDPSTTFFIMQSLSKHFNEFNVFLEAFKESHDK